MAVRREGSVPKKKKPLSSPRTKTELGQTTAPSKRKRIKQAPAYTPPKSSTGVLSTEERKTQAPTSKKKRKEIRKKAIFQQKLSPTTKKQQALARKGARIRASIFPGKEKDEPFETYGLQKKLGLNTRQTMDAADKLGVRAIQEQRLRVLRTEKNYIDKELKDAGPRRRPVLRLESKKHQHRIAQLEVRTGRQDLRQARRLVEKAQKQDVPNRVLDDFQKTQLKKTGQLIKKSAKLSKADKELNNAFNRVQKRGGKYAGLRAAGQADSLGEIKDAITSSGLKFQIKAPGSATQKSRWVSFDDIDAGRARSQDIQGATEFKVKVPGKKKWEHKKVPEDFSLEDAGQLALLLAPYGLAFKLARGSTLFSRGAALASKVGLASKARLPKVLGRASTKAKGKIPPALRVAPQIKRGRVKLAEIKAASKAKKAARKSKRTTPGWIADEGVTAAAREGMRIGAGVRKQAQLATKAPLTAKAAKADSVVTKVAGVSRRHPIITTIAGANLTANVDDPLENVQILMGVGNEVFNQTESVFDAIADGNFNVDLPNADEAWNVVEGMARISYELATNPDVAYNTFRGLIDMGAGLAISPFYLGSEAFKADNIGDFISTLATMAYEDVKHRWEPVVNGDWDTVDEMLNQEGGGGAFWYFADFFPTAVSASWGANKLTLAAAKATRRQKLEDFLTKERPELRIGGVDLQRRGVRNLEKIKEKHPEAELVPTNKVAEFSKDIDLSNETVRKDYEKVKQDLENKGFDRPIVISQEGDSFKVDRDAIRLQAAKDLEIENVPVTVGRGKASEVGLPTVSPELIKGLGARTLPLSNRLVKLTKQRIWDNIGMERTQKGKSAASKAVLLTQDNEIVPYFKFSLSRQQRRAAARYGTLEQLAKQSNLERLAGRARKIETGRLYKHPDGTMTRGMSKEQAEFLPYVAWLGVGRRPEGTTVASLRQIQNDALEWMKIHRAHVLEERKGSKLFEGSTTLHRDIEIQTMDKLIDKLERNPDSIINEGFIRNADEFARVSNEAARMDPALGLAEAQRGIHKTQIELLRRADLLEKSKRDEQAEAIYITLSEKRDQRDNLQKQIKDLDERIEQAKKSKKKSKDLVAKRNELNEAVDELRQDIDTTRDTLRKITGGVSKPQPNRFAYLTDVDLKHVNQAASEAGLAAPFYFPSRIAPAHKNDLIGPEDIRAVAEAKQQGKRLPGNLPATHKQNILYNLGIQDINPLLGLEGIEANVTRYHDFRRIQSAIENFGFAPGLVLAKARTRVPEDVIPSSVKTGVEFRRAIKQAGMNPDDFVILSETALLQKVRKNVLEEGNANIARSGEFESIYKILKDAVWSKNNPIDVHGADLIAIPRQYFNELARELRPSNKIVKVLWDMPKSWAARLLLGTNLSWLQFQVFANATLAGIAGTGPRAWFEANNKWKSLPKEVRDGFDTIVNVSHPYMDVQKMNHSLGGAWGFIANSTWFRRNLQARNPLDPLFMLDRKNNMFFRRAVIWNEAKKEAYRRMNGHASKMMTNLERLHRRTSRSGKGPREAEFDKILANIAKDPKSLDRLAEATNDFLGDYMTFTKTERMVLQRSIMFYGFLRHSIQFTLWNLPVKHPMRFGIMAKIAELAVNDEKDLLQDITGKDMPNIPTPLLGVFYFKGPVDVPGIGEVGVPGINEIDLRRASVAGNFIYELHHPGQIFSVANPFHVRLAEAILGTNFYTGRPLRSGPKANINLPIISDWGNWADRGEYYLEGLASLARPYRKLAEAKSEIPFFLRPDTSTFVGGDLNKGFVYSEESEEETLKRNIEAMEEFKKSQGPRVDIPLFGEVATSPFIEELMPFRPRRSYVSSYLDYYEDIQKERKKAEKDEEKAKLKQVIGGDEFLAEQKRLRRKQRQGSNSQPSWLID